MCGTSSNIEGADEYLYSIRLLIRHPTLSAQSITESLGVAPDYSWDVNDSGRTDSMWSLHSWTEGERLFFDEIEDVVFWLEKKPGFVKAVVESGGRVVLVVQLSGQVNIGDELSPQLMARASAIGVAIGVEVFPNLCRK